MSQLWKGLEHILMPLCMSAKYLSYLFSEVLLSPSYAVKVVGLFIMTRISLWIVLFSNCSVFFRPSVLSTSAALHVAHEWMLWEQSLEICQGGKVNKMSKPVVGIFDNSAGSQQVQLKGGYWCFFVTVSSTFTFSCMQIVVDEMLNSQVFHHFLNTNLFVGSMFLNDQTPVSSWYENTPVLSFNSWLFVSTTVSTVHTRTSRVLSCSFTASLGEILRCVNFPS